MNNQDLLKQSLAKSINVFSTNLNCLTKEIEGNFVISALNVHYALSQCCKGARCETYHEIKDNLSLTNVAAVSVYKEFLHSLQYSPKSNLKIDSKIFTDVNVKVEGMFKINLKHMLSAEIEKIDFLNTQKVVDIINQWSVKETNNKINDIVTIEDIESSTVMILAGIAYFEPNWGFNKFSSKKTEMEPFHLNKNTIKNVAMMQRCFKKIFYMDFDDQKAQCVAIPNEDKNFVFVILIPKEVDGLAKLEENLDNINFKFEDFQKNENWRTITLKMPKFQLNTSLCLNSFLKKMGMIQMFDEHANFKQISSENPIYVNSIFQSTLIDVNETGNDLDVSELRYKKEVFRDSKHVKIDRPFLFQVLNLKNKVKMFNGRIVDPIYK